MIKNLPECKNTDIAEVEIVRHPQCYHRNSPARPGVIIGVKGANIEQIGAILQKNLSRKFRSRQRNQEVEVNASSFPECRAPARPAVVPPGTQDGLFFSNEAGVRA